MTESRPENPQSEPSAGAAAPRPRRPSSVLRSGLRVALVIAVIMGVLRWTGIMESLAFIHPGPAPVVTPPWCQDVHFTAADGTRLHGWFMPARRRPPGAGPAPIVIHIHGNQGSVDIHADWSSFLTERGMSVFLFDYRSYGRSQDVGRYLTREQLLVDARAALDAVLARTDIDRSRIGLYGVSLGGSFALALAAERPEVASVCTLATFSSWPGVASDHVPVLGHLLIRSGMSQAENAARLGRRPLLIVHGDRDDIVSVRHASVIERSASTAGVPVESLIVRGANHLNILNERYDAERRIAEFFERTLRVRESGTGASTR